MRLLPPSFFVTCLTTFAEEMFIIILPPYFRDSLLLSNMDWTEAETSEISLPSTVFFSSSHFSMITDFIVRGILPSLAAEG
jgi:hypothetical protein